MRKPSTIVSLLYSGVVLVIGLLSCEIVHYCIATDIAFKDEQYTAWRYSHGGCKVHPDEPDNFTCPLDGYNWVEVECLTSLCTYRDPNAPAMTLQRQVEHEHNLKEDLKASLYTVPLVPREKAQKILFASRSPHTEEKAENPDSAIKLMNARELKGFRDVAQKGHP